MEFYLQLKSPFHEEDLQALMPPSLRQESVLQIHKVSTLWPLFSILSSSHLLLLLPLPHFSLLAVAFRAIYAALGSLRSSPFEYCSPRAVPTIFRLSRCVGATPDFGGPARLRKAHGLHTLPKYRPSSFLVRFWSLPSTFVVHLSHAIPLRLTALFVSLCGRMCRERSASSST